MKTFALLAALLLATHGVVDAARYAVTGTVVQLRPETSTMVVAHKDIPGFMPAMTMPFKVQDAASLKGLAMGDVVEFTFVVEDASSHAEGVHVVGHAAMAAAAPPAARAAALREGSTVPRVSLVDQDGKPLSLADSNRWTVLTFIFTRCPVPEFCPRMATNFHALQQRLEATGRKDVRLLSITMDPAFDRPNVLTAYGKAVGADFSTWDFATGDPDQIDRLTSAFRVFVRKNGVTLDHTLCTALVAPDGRIARIWRGNGWTVDELMHAVEESR